MFDNIHWSEILVLLVVILIIIGPERLPGVIKDVRAAIFAARRAIANARAELDGTLGDDLKEFREPLSQAAEWSRMGPRRAITKALFDGDESALDDFDPRTLLSEAGIDTTRETPQQAARRLRRQADALEKRSAAGRSGSGRSGQASAPEQRRQQPTRNPQGPPPAPKNPSQSKGNYETGGGFSWEDIT
ncbi:Sec-independent protein translocase TatB [Corynebacterium yudongzhengii]|uniref:Sec-independent protein translocase protein TatB n=1 Tax=Corynebacterium yudongzhengii TaxID=2080740 RepID=A0A2U1T9G7_9CORY|nr:twin-arginine translocase TatA/TatE family subunit [Corynebacterium yudongzhengii]AWB82153.1 Sec-independent protein translocase TatB [Corynebacterium yudongzhengii]PWC02657.1 Sec-independent protein translocase TatB [Corynebacterium yudongzhengii]